jgi:hypothetical protein
LKGIGEEVEYVQLFDQTTNKVYYVLRRKKQEQEEIEEEKLTEILDIKLKGKEVVTLNIGDDYTDEGAEATLENKKTKVKKKLPTSEIDVAVFKDHQLIGDLDNMDTNEPGEYEIKYTVEAEETFEGEVKPQTREVTRIVKIEGVKNEVEEIEHTLTLEVLGDNPATLQQGETFVDEGAIATWDGEDVSEDIKVTGTVDTNTP